MDITLSFLSRSSRTYAALLLPFFFLYRILAFEVAVIAVSDPDKKPERITRIISYKRRNILGIKYFLKSYKLYSYQVFYKKLNYLFYQLEKN